jgi:hypothetical protein
VAYIHEHVYRVGIEALGSHDHLQPHRQSPGGLPIDMTSGVLDPEGDQDAKVDKTLLDGDDTTTDSKLDQHRRSQTWVRHVLPRTELSLVEGDLASH